MQILMVEMFIYSIHSRIKKSESKYIFFAFVSNVTQCFILLHVTLQQDNEPKTPRSKPALLEDERRPMSPACHGFPSTVAWPRPHSTFVVALEDGESQAPCDIKKTLCGTLSGRPEITADKIRFSTNLWSPCQRECRCSKKGMIVSDGEIFWNSWTFFRDSTVKLHTISYSLERRSQTF